jgi:hypothetical protein
MSKGRTMQLTCVAILYFAPLLVIYLAGLNQAATHKNDDPPGTVITQDARQQKVRTVLRMYNYEKFYNN